MSELDHAAALTIREVSARSGISEGTLRMWETRYSFPTPPRLASGHRRYSERSWSRSGPSSARASRACRCPGRSSTPARLGDRQRPSVFRRAARGLSLPAPAAAGQACAAGAEPGDRGRVLRARRAPDPVRLLSARAQLPARGAALAGDGPHRRAGDRAGRLRAQPPAAARPRRGRDRGERPAEAGVGAGVREPGFGACLAAWERLGQRGSGGPSSWSGRSSARWSVAARACCELAARSAPRYVEELRERLEAPASSGGQDLRAAVDLTTRMVLYAAGGRGAPLD